MRGLWTIIGTLLFIFLGISLVNAQSFLDSLEVREFNQGQYRVASFNYAGIQGRDKRIYFANESGMLCYNGSNWQLAPVKEFKSVFSIAQADDSTVYLGGDSEFGYMREIDGDFQYTSLTPLLADTFKIGEIWQTLVYEDAVYFSGYYGIFKYDGNRITRINLTNGHIFSVDGKLIVSVIEKGLYELVDDQPILRNPDAAMADDMAFAFIPQYEGGGYYMVTSENGLFEFNVQTFNVNYIDNELSDLTKEIWSYDATTFGDSLYAISTWSSGLVIANKALEIQKVINSKKGLNTDEMREVFEGERGHLWVGTNSGISEIYWPGYEREIADVSTILTAKEKDGQNGISFEFATPGYHISEIKYTFYLEGLKKEFGPLRRDFIKEYPNLNGGEYTFRVKAKLPDGNFSKEAHYSFILPTPFYLAPKFVVSIILVPVSLFFLFYYLRTKRLKLMNERLEAIVASRTRELVAKQRQLQETNNHLKVINSELDNFVYRSSHDLVAPLKSLRGLISLASIDQDEKNLNTYFEKMNSSVVKLEEFIHSIMDYVTNSKVELSYDHTKFDDMVESVCDDLRFYEGADKIRLLKSYELDLEICCDIKRINILLSNLITNAIKYHNYDQEDPYVEVGLKELEGEYEFLIHDNGSGISKKHQKKIFDMFYRASENSQGSGLGLYIVQETLKTLGGRIEVESKEGKGTTFKIFISRVPDKETVLA
ncbi:MAG: HAMP domain-containing sensor histidine kinase [Bacteroidota bacterium]